MRRQNVGWFFLCCAMMCLAIGTIGSAEGESDVLATYDEGEVTLKDLGESQPALLSWVGITAGEDNLHQAVEDILFGRLLVREARDSRLEDEPSVRAQIDKILSAAYYKRHVNKDKIEVTESDIDAYYNANLKRYKVQELVKVSHILVKSEKEGLKVISALEKGEDWKALAAKESMDLATAKRGGLLGSVPPNSLLPEMREAIKELKAGEYSPLVKSAFGYHIVRLEEGPSLSYRAMEEVRKEIYTELMHEREAKLRQALLDSLWRKYDVSFKPSSIKGVVEQKTAENMHIERDKRRLRQPGQATELQVVSETLDLGPLPAKKFVKSLLVANNSQREISIDRVGSTCPCIKVSIERTKLGPGQATNLSFTYDPTVLQEKGASQRVLFIESNDSIEPRKFIRLNAEIM